MPFNIQGVLKLVANISRTRKMLPKKKIFLLNFSCSQIQIMQTREIKIFPSEDAVVNNFLFVEFSIFRGSCKSPLYPGV